MSGKGSREVIWLFDGWGGGEEEKWNNLGMFTFKFDWSEGDSSKRFSAILSYLFSLNMVLRTGFRN
jgi:hypothetical protein